MTTINPPIFLRLLTASILSWATIVFCFILLINPYGVSIINYKFRHFNASKPKRIDIDRIIKPFEVAIYKPRTVFIGTSRIHRSIDPSVLDGTPFAPAYNASIPASTLSENANFLADFFSVDPNLKYVFVELYVYNFIHDQSKPPERETYWLARNSFSLFFSADALLASLQTISANAWGRQGAEIKEQGFFRFGPGLDTAIRFSEKWFIDSTLDTHKNIPAISLRPSSISALDHIIETCKRNNAEVFLLIAPNYPWDDYRLKSLGYWTMVEDWTRLLASYENVYSFAAYNAATEETPGSGMKFWYDPIHFSLAYGEVMMNAFLGRPGPYSPASAS